MALLLTLVVTVETDRQDCSLNYDTSVLPKAVPASYSRLLSSKGHFLIYSYGAFLFSIVAHIYSIYAKISPLSTRSQYNMKTPQV